MVRIIKCLHMFPEAFISLHLHTSKITVPYAAAEFILQEYSLCTSSRKKMIKSPDATDINISSSESCQNKDIPTTQIIIY